MGEKKHFQEKCESKGRIQKEKKRKNELKCISDLLWEVGFLIKRKWKKCGVGGEEGENQAIVVAEYKGKGMWGKGAVQTHSIYHS